MGANAIQQAGGRGEEGPGGRKPTIGEKIVFFAFRLGEQAVLVRELVLALGAHGALEHLLPDEVDLHAPALSAPLPRRLVGEHAEPRLVGALLEPL